MMDRRKFEQQYRQWKREETPELWDRIENQLKEHPEREIPKEKIPENGISKKKRQTKWIFGTAAAAAAAVVFVAAVPVIFREAGIRKGLEDKNPAMEAASGHEEVFEEETKGAPSGEGDAGRMEAAQPEAARPEAAGPEQAAAARGGFREEEAGGDQILELGAGGRLQVPEGAVTVQEDAGYFSEAILADTELLCTGTVESASLEYDGQGRAVKVVYRLRTEQIHYAQDYADGGETLLVESPIIKAEGDKTYVLYQLKENGTYLLPLKSREGSWELIYPFAPQIEITGEGAYRFHSGYASMVNQGTKVAAGIREGENDYFYDRMLIRRDSEFISQFLSLVKQEKGGE